MKNIIAISILLLSQQGYTQGCFTKCRDHLSAPLRSGENVQNRIEQSANVLQALVGCHTPEFNVTTIKGELLNSKDLRGKVIVMNFWFESCDGCVKDLPMLNQLVNDYAGKDVVFIAFSRDAENQINKFIAGRNLNYQIVSSQYDMTNDFCVIGGWPMNVIIDKKGIVRYIEAGSISASMTPSHKLNALKLAIARNL